MASNLRPPLPESRSIAIVVSLSLSLSLVPSFTFSLTGDVWCDYDCHSLLAISIFLFWLERNIIHKRERDGNAIHYLIFLLAGARWSSWICRSRLQVTFCVRVCIQGPHVDGCSPETLFIISKLTETCLFPPILIWLEKLKFSFCFVFLPGTFFEGGPAGNEWWEPVEWTSIPFYFKFCWSRLPGPFHCFSAYRIYL
jgi:hypothetical protein